MSKGFMELNLKNASPQFRPEHVQAIMVARKEAHYFDVSHEVTEKCEQIMEATVGLKSPRFPTPKGYIRFNWPLESISINIGDDVLLRINGALWSGTKVYFTVDPLNESVRIVPFVIDLEARSYDDPIVKDRERLGYHLIGPANADHVLHAEVIAYNVDPQTFNHFQGPLSDFICMMSIAFDMFGEIAATEQVRERVPRPFATKHQPFYEKTSLVKIKLNRCRTKYLKRTGESTGRKMGYHEPRGHWCHYRITKPDCPHSWIDRLPDDSKKQKCAHCGEWRTWREFPHGKGDRARAVIHTHYEVVT